MLVGATGARATLPAKAQIDKDGPQKKGVNGRAAYVAVLEWQSRELNDRFSNAVVSMVRWAHPGDLEES